MDKEKTKGTPSKRRTASATKAAPKGKAPVKKRREEPQKSPRGKAAPKRSAAPAAPKHRSVRATPKPQRPTAPAQPAPEVVYTPGKPFNKGRLVLLLCIVVAVVLAFSSGIAIFFKVEVITVSGSDKYDVWTVKEASGIELGDNLLSFGKAKAAGKIKTALPYVQSVRIGIKLPDTVNIEIKELDVVYTIKDAVEQWWLITSDGRVVDKADLVASGDYTQILGVKLMTPVAGQQAVAHEEAVASTETTGSLELGTLPPVVTASDRLKTALNILQYMEDCGIIGEALYVDVAELGDIELKYGSRFTVKLGDTTQLFYKIKCMDAAINGKDESNLLKDYDSGVLDISFTIKEDQVIYQPTEE